MYSTRWPIFRVNLSSSFYPLTQFEESVDTFNLLPLQWDGMRTSFMHMEHSSCYSLQVCVAYDQNSPQMSSGHSGSVSHFWRSLRPECCDLCSHSRLRIFWRAETVLESDARVGYNRLKAQESKVYNLSLIQRACS